MANGQETIHTKQEKQHPTLGLLVHSLSFDLRLGVEDFARENNANVICFPGGIVRDPLGFNSQANILYDLLKSTQVDGLIIWTGAITGHLSAKEFTDFCNHYSPLPIVGVGSRTPEIIPLYDTGGYQEMCAEISHLIEVHGCRRIAFLCGASTHSGAKIRYEAYIETLKKHDLPIEPGLITPPNDNWENQECGMEAVFLLLDNRRLIPGKDFDAIVAANDVLALGALDALQSRGIKIPQEVALTGFDDKAESSYVTPPLTTVRRDYYDGGRKAAEWTLDLMRGRPLSPQSPAQNNLILRQSCGCPDPNILMASEGRDRVPGELFHPAWDAQKEMILAKMFQTVGPSPVCPNREWLENLIDSYSHDLKAEQPGMFISTLDKILGWVAAAGGRIITWQNTISVLRSETLALINTPDMQPKAETLLGQARILIGSLAQRAEGYQRLRVDRQSQILNEFQTAMTTMFNVAGLMEVLGEFLPRLGIPSCYLALYENPQPYQYPQPVPEWSRLMLAYNEKGNIALDENGLRFPTHQLVPDGLLPVGRTYSYIVEPLYYRTDQLGFVFFEVGPHEKSVYETLQGQISSALRSNQLFQEAAEGRRLAEEANRLKTRFLSIVSHELRTPLNIIVGLSELLLRQHPQVNSSEIEDLRRIYSSAQHLGYLIRDVLDLARSDAGQLRLNCEPLDLVEIMQVVLVTGEQLAAEQGLSWIAKMPSGKVTVWGDRTRLRQVALNFVANAVKFTPKGTITFSIETDDKNVTVLVNDTGVGIPPEDQTLIFGEFQQSERTIAAGYSGLGLGLSVSKQLIDLHGGTIGVRGSGVEGQGSTFFFTLPILVVKSTPAELVELLPQQPTLLLTDQPESGEQMRMFLVGKGFEVVSWVVKPGEDWFSVLVDVSPAVLLIDRGLISTNTWENIRKFKERPKSQGIPVVFFEWQPDQNSGSIFELNYHLKPLDAEQLQMVISSPAQEGNPPTILLVDDDPNILDVHSRLIHQHFPGCVVIQARNGQEALQIVDLRRPDLILLDLMMPVLDGFGVLDALQENESTRDIPVTVLTGRVLSESDLTRLNRGVTMVLEKGIFSAEETLERVSTTLFRVDKSRNAARRVVAKAIAFIHEHYPEPITREQIAEYVHVHENHLTNCFHQALGISLMTYLSRFRINQARTLLEAGELNITEVAMAVGFADSSYFGRIFQREVGISPGNYRHGQRPHSA